MNQNIDHQSLTVANSYYLQNILPSPLGSGSVRFGTKSIEISGSNPIPLDAEIISTFSYINPTNQIKQLILCSVEFEKDTSFDVNGSSSFAPQDFTFVTSAPHKYLPETKIKVLYSLDNTPETIRAYIRKNEAAADGNYKITFDSSTFPNTEGQLGFGPPDEGTYYQVIKLYLYDYSTNAITLIENNILDAGTIPRAVTFKNYLLICNGINRVRRWDGSSLDVQQDHLGHPDAKVFKRSTDIKQATYKYDNNILGYAVDLLSKITLYVDNVEHIGVITLTSNNTTTKTVTITSTTDFPVLTGKAVKIFYTVNLPRFSSLFVAHNRIWGLSEGRVQNSFRKDSMIIYYSHSPETLNFVDESTGTIPYIDISYKQGKPDCIEAISSVSDKLVFFGRSKTQVWTGKNPTDVNNFVWESTLDAGIAHGELKETINGDLYFISQNGIMRLTTNESVAHKAMINKVSALDPIVNRYILSLTSNRNYWACKAFNYKKGGFFGFKIGQNDSVVGYYADDNISWCLFSGAFKFSGTLNADSSALYVTQNNNILIYADGSDGTEKVYNDNGQPILFNWTTPVVQNSKKRFACKRYELDAEYTSSFTLNENNSFNLVIFGDLKKQFNLESVYKMDMRGDVIDKIALRVNDPDLDNSDDEGLRLAIPYLANKKRLKFVASSFFISAYGQQYNSPLVIKKITLYGRVER